MRLYKFFSVLLLLPCCVMAVENSKQIIHDVSLISLIASPEKFEGKFVRVVGVRSLGKGHDLLCLSSEDVEMFVSRNCLHLGKPVSAHSKAPSENYNRVHVIVEGFFVPPPVLHIRKEDGTMEQLGYFGLPIGEIRDIKRFDKWSITPKE